MRIWLASAAAALLTAASPAAAVPITITYAITSGGGISDLFTGPGPIGGTVVVTWAGSPPLVTGPAKLVSAKVTHPSRTVTFAPFTDPTAQIYAGPVGLFTATTQGIFTTAPPPGATNTYFKYLRFWHEQGVTGTPTFSLVLYRRLTGYFSGSPTDQLLTLTATGHEVARTPEPGSAPLAGLGLLALAWGVRRKKTDGNRARARLHSS